MTRKDYTAVAKTIKEQYEFILDGPESKVAEQTVFNTASRLAEIFRKDNAAFDINKFMSACGF